MASQFAHKQPTRFNAPEIPQDLATKAYVDGLAGDFFMIGTNIAAAVAANDTRFTGWYARAGWATADTLRTTCFPNNIILDRFIAHIGINNSDGNTVLSNFEVVGSTLGNSSVTIPLATTGIFQDTTNEDSFTIAQLAAIQNDTTDITSGDADIASVSTRGHWDI